MGELIGLVAVLLIFGVTPVAAIWSSHRKDLVRLRAEEAGGRAEQLVASNQELEDRIRVLERIVTDKGYDVATQIEALRDQRKADRQLAELEDRSPM